MSDFGTTLNNLRKDYEADMVQIQTYQERLDNLFSVSAILDSAEAVLAGFIHLGTTADSVAFHKGRLSINTHSILCEFDGVLADHYFEVEADSRSALLSAAEARLKSIKTHILSETASLINQTVGGYSPR